MSTSPRRFGILLAIAVMVLGSLPAPVIATPVTAPGTISGLFTGTNGRPVMNAQVAGESLTDPAHSFVTFTRLDGRFRATVQPGQYRVRFRQQSGAPDQWATGKENERQAEVITVESGKEVVLEEKALPTGRIEGRLLASTGRPAVLAGVVVENAGLERFFQATTNALGTWFVTVWPGTYRVRFETISQVQWAHGHTSPETADTITVLADKTTVVNDRLGVPGSLSVTAQDAHTGDTVMSFCAEANNQFKFNFVCTEDGVAEFDELGASSYTVIVSDSVHLAHTTENVVVTSGQAASVTASMGLGATVVVTVTDAATGEPVESVCLGGRPAERAPEFGEFFGSCTDSTGIVTIERVVPDRYVLFASVADGLHGSQWVGPGGGVGTQAQAMVLDATENSTVEVDVRLDPAGTIGGVITDAKTGEPIENAEIVVADFVVTSLDDGSYQIDNLGPYEWVVYFGHEHFGGQWPGGGGNRLSATPIPVLAGQTTPYDVALLDDTKLTGRITGAAGEPPVLAEVSVFNAKTFDPMHHAVVGADGVYTAPLTGPQEVKVFVFALFAERAVAMWYPDAKGFAGGQTVSIPTAGTTVLDIPIR